MPGTPPPGESPPENTGEITNLLRAAAGGDAAARDRLAPIVYEELRKLAAHAFRTEAADLSMRPTDLVHDVLVRLLGAEAQWNDRGHFFTVAARAMRRLLIDHARARTAEKRGGGTKPLPLDAVVSALEYRSKDLLRLHEALDALAERDPIKANLVELRFFGGLTLPDAARVIGMSRTTAEREWALARAWLHREISRP